MDGPAKRSRAEHVARRSNAFPVPVHLLLAALSAAVCLAALFVAGLAWSSALPVSAAVFVAVSMTCLAAREIRPVRRHMPPPVAEETAATTPAAILDMLPGLVTRHDASGHLVSVHGADCRSYGLSPQRFQPSAFLDSVHVAGRIAYLSAIDDLRQGAARAEAEFLFACASSENGYRPVRASLTAELSPEGRFAGFVAQTGDVAAEARLKDEIECWKMQARSANDAKTRFLAAVSHELRTPLNAILGFSDILIGEYFGKFENERQKEYVGLINQSGHHLLAVVNTMLDMSKIEAGRYDLVKEPFDIADAVRTVDEMLALQARSKGVVLTARIARGIDDVVADRRAIQQVLINLAGNAIKFTPEGGVVAIDATASGRNLILTISDTGIGIAADKLASLGKPFVQVQNDYTRRYDGTGLGLALVKGLAALHGGTFAIESEEGVGTVTTVTIPLDGKGDAGAETFEFPPRLQHQEKQETTGENRHGAAKAKIA